MNNKHIAEILNKIADTLEVHGDNPYRVKAYRRAANSIYYSDLNIEECIKKGAPITQIRYVGKGIAKHIAEFVLNKNSDISAIIKNKKTFYNDLKYVAGLGPKRIRLLSNTLQINTRKQLLSAIKKNQLSELPGFTPKFQQKILQSIKRPNYKEKFFRIKNAEVILQALTDYLTQMKSINRLAICGNFRRKQDVIGNLDILVSAPNTSVAINDFLNYEGIEVVISRTKNSARVILISGMIIALHAIENNCWSAALVYYTGSRKHIRQLNTLAHTKNYKLQKTGLFKAGEMIVTRSEKSIYAKIGLCYIEPELREGRGEINASSEDKLPKLIELADLRGDLHSHTIATDGTATIEAMVYAAIEKGYRYLAITDHTKRLAITNGLDEQRLLQQIKKIDKLNGQLNNFTILKGSEVDILEDGSLDLPNWILKELDIRVCSLHSRFNYSKEKQTERILRAMDNPYFNILGHPTGRLLFHRKGYPLDFEKIFQAAKDRGCCMELNAQPARLDLNDELCLMAKQMGIKFAISSDAHSINELNNIRLGINQARRGWLESKDVINTRKVSDLKKLLIR